MSWCPAARRFYAIHQLSSDAQRLGQKFVNMYLGGLDTIPGLFYEEIDSVAMIKIDEWLRANHYIEELPQPFPTLQGYEMKLFAPTVIDLYKPGHMTMYPSGTQQVYSNFTARDDKYGSWLPDFDHKTSFIGLQGVIKDLFIDLWNESFFHRNKADALSRYMYRMDSSLGPGAVSTDHFAALHDLGYLPLRIKALPEGSRVNLRVPSVTIINTDARFAWLTNYIETQFSTELWKPITAATVAYEYYRLLNHYATLTGSPQEFVQWQGHDFSARGLSGMYDGAKTGIGHLAAFRGSDTVHAMDYVEDRYGLPAGYMLAGSVPATEHSVMCLGGQESEIETFTRIIRDVYPVGIVSGVSDTWDFWDLITNGARKMKDVILARRPNALGQAKTVFRPDSGDPVLVVCGDPSAPVGSPQYKGAVECLWETFGGTTTSKGFRVLHERVGLIYGDSINLDRARRILEGLAFKGFASCNIVLGIGSYTYQMLSRDTFGHAYKATWAMVNNEGRELFKDPKTDSGMKKSAKGLLRVEQTDDGNFVLFDQQTPAQEAGGALRTVFENGELKIEESWQTIRRRLGCITD